MQEIWKLGRHCIQSGIVYSDHNGITSGDSYIGSKRNKSDYLSTKYQVPRGQQRTCRLKVKCN